MPFKYRYSTTVDQANLAGKDGAGSDILVERDAPSSDELDVEDDDKYPSFDSILSIIGGRLSYISKVTKAIDMQSCADQMLCDEREWLLSQIGLIPDCDDDVMDEVSIVISKILLYACRCMLLDCSNYLILL